MQFIVLTVAYKSLSRRVSYRDNWIFKLFGRETESKLNTMYSRYVNKFHTFKVAFVVNTSLAC